MVWRVGGIKVLGRDNAKNLKFVSTIEKRLKKQPL